MDDLLNRFRAFSPKSFPILESVGTSLRGTFSGTLPSLPQDELDAALNESQSDAEAASILSEWAAAWMEKPEAAQLTSKQETTVEAEIDAEGAKDGLSATQKEKDAR